MKKVILIILIFVIFVISFGTTYEEAFELRNSYGLNKEKIKKKIMEYENKIDNNKNNYSDFAAGILYSILSTLENTEDDASCKAKEYMEKSLEKNKENYIIISYTAFAHSLVARDKNNPFIKMSESKKATKLYDKAVKLGKRSSNEWLIRFQRANSYINFPDFLGKKKTAEEDFIFVENEYKTFPYKIDEKYMVNVYYYRGEAEKAKGEKNKEKSLEYWKKCIEISNRLKYENIESKKAEEEIKKIYN